MATLKHRSCYSNRDLYSALHWSMTRMIKKVVQFNPAPDHGRGRKITLLPPAKLLTRTPVEITVRPPNDVILKFTANLTGDTTK